jgi:hypothetical protein
MTYRELGPTYDIVIEESTLNESGYTRFTLSPNGNGNGSAIMTLYNVDNRRIIYCNFYKSDLDKTVKSLEEKLSSDGMLIDDETARSLVTYFRNQCVILKQDKRFFLSGGGNYGKHSQEENKEEQTQKEIITNDNNIKNKIITGQDIKFVLDTMSKEAPYDKVSIKQLFYGMNSAFTKCPIHHSVNSRKTGAGKTHDLTLVSGYYPKKYVIALAGMSDKALFHRHGVNVIVDEDTGNTIPVQPLIDDLENTIEDLVEEANKQTNKELKKANKKQIQKCETEIQELRDKSQELIELDNKIFLFLDTAQEGLFNTLMSMISQDSSDQLYEFTDKSGGGKMGSKINRLRGTPTVFNTQVIDDTRQIRYQEKNRRLIHVTCI